MRPTAWLAIALLATLIGALAVWHEERGIEQTREASAHRTFSLLDQQGHTITDQTFRGEWLIVFFGYTSCPDFCPTTLFLLHQTLQKLQGRARSVRVLFITVDPERDTPEKLAAYLLNLGPKFVGGTGTEQQIEAAKQAFRAYSRKQSAGADGWYAVDHSTQLYVMDPDGRLARQLSSQSTPEQLAMSLRTLIDHS